MPVHSERDLPRPHDAARVSTVESIADLPSASPPGRPQRTSARRTPIRLGLIRPRPFHGRPNSTYPRLRSGLHPAPGDVQRRRKHHGRRRRIGPGELRPGPQLGVEFDRFRRAVGEKTSAAISDAVHLAETWLDGVTALPAGTSKSVAWTPNDWVDDTLETWKRLCDPVAERSPPCGPRRCRKRPRRWLGRCWR